MPNSKKIKEIQEKIEVEKEILSTMPKNNEKNLKKYKEKLEELQKEYEKYKNEIVKILKEIYEKETSIEETSKIENLDSRLNTIMSKLYLFNEYKTSYEKMELDKIIYKIGKYYKENLENINNQIAECIKKFNGIGIKLELSDFDYSIYVKQYMEIFLEEMEKDTLLSERVKAKFDDIYWKCPEIILHIELNIRNIYLKKETQIDKYFEKEKKELLKKWDKEPKEIFETYLRIKREQLKEKSEDKKTILDEFLLGKLNIKNYTQDKIKNELDKILPQDVTKNLEDNEEEIEKNIIKFSNSLYEYKNYMKFKFIVEDIKNHYKEKENYKKGYIETKKKIDVAEKKLRKLNKKAESKSFFGTKKQVEKQSNEQKQLILQLKTLYKELDLNKFYNKIYTCIVDETKVYEVLKLASSYYGYLVNCIIRNNETITQEEIDVIISNLDDFLKNPYNTIINNLTILEEKDVAIIIKDRYKLLNFMIEKEDISLNNVDNLVSTLDIIEKSFCMKRVGLTPELIEEILRLRKILITEM